MEIHSFSDESTLIAEIALSGTASLRTILAPFLRRAKGDLAEITFDKLMAVLGGEFKKDSAGRAANRMRQFNTSHQSVGGN